MTQKDPNITLTPSDVNVATIGLTVEKWSPVSPLHIHSACYLSKRATKFEDEKNKPPSPTLHERYEHQAYVIGSVFAARAFLESMINDLFIEAVRETEHKATNKSLQLLPLEVTKSMACAWDLRLIDRRSMLDKYQFVWQLISKQKISKQYGVKAAPLSKQMASWADVGLLIELRNYLMHFKSETVIYQTELQDSTYELDEQTEKLRKKLEAHTFKNQLVKDQGAGFYPLEYLVGADCAKWAVEKSLDFAEEFSRETNITLLPDVHTLFSKRHVAGCGL